MVEMEGRAGGALSIVNSGTTHTVTVTSGNTEDDAGTVPHSSETYFTYGSYQPYITIAGNGTTILNVYYTRNSYTLTFNLNRTDTKN